MADVSTGGLQSGINLVSDAVVFADPAGQIVFANSAASRLLGDAVLIGRPFEKLFERSTEFGRAQIAQAVADALGGVEQRVSAAVQRADGERRSVLVRIAPVPAEGVVASLATPQGDGIPDTAIVSDGFVAAVHDTTGEQQLGQLAQTQKLEAIGQLVSGVAHELNNPLASVMAYAQLMLGSPTLDADDRQAVDTMLHETRRAARIVANLLTFARRHQPSRSVTDVNQIVSDTIALRRYGISESRIGLTVDLDPGIPLTWADSFQIQQVLMNLLTNAEQALSDWANERRILVRSWHEQGMVSLSVSDTGPGIDATIYDQIFNPFFTTKGVGEGTGLGLSISDGIVREHGGRIRVDSVPGSGASFIVELPLVDPALSFLNAESIAGVSSAALHDVRHAISMPAS